MSFSDHPLLDVFSEAELERLGQGRCVESNAAADDNIAGMLTEHYDHPNSYTVSLATWFRQAASHGCAVRGDYRHRLRSTVFDRGAFHQVCGELTAAYLLERQLSFDLEYVPRQENPTPDFAIRKNNLALMVEVKTIVGGGSGGRYAGAFPNSAPAMRKAMDNARRQLDRNANNLIVIADWWQPGVPRSHAVDALYGDLKLAVLMGPDGPVGDWHGVRKDASCQMRRNTRIGALAVVGWPGVPECVAFFIHNGYAANRIPGCAFDPWPQFVLDEAESRMVWRNLPKR